MDVKDGMHCNIPWPRCGGSLGGVRCALWRHSLFTLWWCRSLVSLCTILYRWM